MNLKEKQAALDNVAKEIAKLKPKFPEAHMPVPGEGSPNAKVIFLGQAPGRKEDETGRPFIGMSGKFLTKQLTRIGIDREDVFITSPVHFWLGSHDKPPPEIIAIGKPFTDQQIKIIDPKIVVFLGKSAQEAFIDDPILEGRTIIPTIHPSAAMRFTKMRMRFEADFDHLKQILEKG